MTDQIPVLTTDSLYGTSVSRQSRTPIFAIVVNDSLPVALEEATDALREEAVKLNADAVFGFGVTTQLYSTPAFPATGQPSATHHCVVAYGTAVWFVQRYADEE